MSVQESEWWDIAKVVIILAVVALVIYAVVASLGGGGEYTKADCIQQWRDSGMLGNVDKMCAQYP